MSLPNDRRPNRPWMEIANRSDQLLKWAHCRCAKFRRADPTQLVVNRRMNLRDAGSVSLRRQAIYCANRFLDSLYVRCPHPFNPLQQDACQAVRGVCFGVVHDDRQANAPNPAQCVSHFVCFYFIALVERLGQFPRVVFHLEGFIVLGKDQDRGPLRCRRPCTGFTRCVQ